MGTTTIQIDAETRDQLARLKSTPRETYDELLRKLLALIPEGDEEGRYSQGFRLALLNARLDIRAGRVTPHDRVKKDLGL